MGLLLVRHNWILEPNYEESWYHNLETETVTIKYCLTKKYSSSDDEFELQIKINGKHFMLQYLLHLIFVVSSPTFFIPS